MTPAEILSRAYLIVEILCLKFPQYKNVLQDIHFELNNRFTFRAADANWKNKRIRLSLPFFTNGRNKQELKETILHEIAHILAPKGSNHNWEWRMICRSIGGNGKRCHNMEVRTNRENVYCQRCNSEVKMGPTQKKRMDRGVLYIHGKCGGDLIERRRDGTSGKS